MFEQVEFIQTFYMKATNHHHYSHSYLFPRKPENHALNNKSCLPAPTSLKE